jgi:nucleoside-diphosphate-sugar epimerase
MKKAIVTGANGFIGSWLIKELLKNNVEVIAIVRNEQSNTETIPENVKIVYSELDAISDLANKVFDRDIDVFYHLAWTGTGGKARADYELQLLNSKYTCDSAIVAKELNCKKFICTGTITEKIAENILNINVKAENTIFGIAKHTAHCLLDVLCKKLDLPYVWARLSNIYGCNNSTGNIFSYTLGELQQGKRPAFSKAEQPYDLMYVKDAARALYLLGEEDTKKNCYFVGSGEARILKEYLISIRDIFGNDAEIGLGEKPEDGLQYYKEWFETMDLQKDLDFKAAYTFEEGAKETIEGNKQLS